jgi:hypothetical protein
MLRWILLAATLASGCYGSAQQAREAQTASSPTWRCASPPQVTCPGKPECTGWDSSWLASCTADQRQYACSMDGHGNVTCQETQRSHAKILVEIVTDRLALETGCDKNRIRIVNKTEWVRGSEEAYRLEACGSLYVCTTAAGRTDCKSAMATTTQPR